MSRDRTKSLDTCVVGIVDLYNFVRRDSLDIYVIGIADLYIFVITKLESLFQKQ